MNQVGIIKQHDKDLQLYNDMAKTLYNYRVSMIDILEINKWKKLRKKHRELLNRLAKRLNIKTLDNL